MVSPIISAGTGGGAIISMVVLAFSLQKSVGFAVSYTHLRAHET